MSGSDRSSRGKRQRDKSTNRGGEPAPDRGAVAAAPQRLGGGFLQKLCLNMGLSADLDDMTAGEIVTLHPLVRVGKFVFVPYLLYIGYFYLRLQHPEYVSLATGGLIHLRPAVHGTDALRQVLVVATPGSGTVQMASELGARLKLEIGHESADAAWDFVRDGSVSWFHGIRFLAEPRDAGERVKSWAKICNSDYDTHSNMGFHPAMYGPPRGGCSYRSRWDECWKSECYVRLAREWGCALSDSCETGFARSLHQVRNPVDTIQSLVVKFCVGGVDGVMATPFLTYASALFPSHDFRRGSCVEAVGSFVAEYMEAMAEARRRGRIDAFYRIEESSACDVAAAAGLLSANTTVYGLNHVRISLICDGVNLTTPARKRVEKRLNMVNKDQVRLGWKNLRGHGSGGRNGDRALEGRVRNLFKVFGYDETTVPIKYEPVTDHSEL